ncbi:MAG: DNA primase [Clostridiales bacterium]|nr:DNA primase [Clostridiales bacterium]
MALPDSFIQELLSRNDIETVVSPYVRLKRRGRNLVGLCPFHGEKSPSFTLYPDTASFYCFGCGAGGDVITFIKRIENLDYLDAVRFLADRAGMKMPEDNKDDAVGRLRLRVLQANRDAARFFHSVLYSPAGKAGLDYYYGRGYTDHTIRRFGLGYAPDDFHTLRDYMRGKGYKDEELIAAFLSKRSANGGHLYDIFRNRVIIPIIDIRGNVIAFGGRVLDDSKPKYLNSSDTLVFKKTNNLFALNFAKAAAKGKLILCEGYMDVIALHQAGFQNAVAALGTSFTAEHARLIARYAEEVTLVFDADAAGQKGTKRAIGLLRDTGVDIRVIAIPDGKDPDEFIRLHGPERFKLLMERAANDVEYRLIELGRQYPLSTADGRVLYLREASRLLAELPSPIERDVYAGKLSAELSVSKDAILAQIEGNRKRQQKQQQGRQLSQIVRRDEETLRRTNPEAQKHPRAVSAEEGLLGMLILNPDYIGAAAAKLPPEQMVTAFNRRLYERLLERHGKDMMVDLPFLAADFSEEEMAYITRMVREARERVNSPGEVEQYADVIIGEHGLLGLEKPEELSAESIQRILDTMRGTRQ